MAEAAWTGALNAAPPPNPFEDIVGQMSQADLLRLRTTAGADQGLQNYLAPYEHGAFAREYVQDNPMTGPLAMGMLVPGYTLAKLAGLHGGRSDPSLAEITQGYQGIWEGLQRAFSQGGV